MRALNELRTDLTEEMKAVQCEPGGLFEAARCRFRAI